VETGKDIRESKRLFIISCFEKGIHDTGLKGCGFKSFRKRINTAKGHKFITFPVPFNISPCHVCYALLLSVRKFLNVYFKKRVLFFMNPNNPLTVVFPYGQFYTPCYLYP
jgi:hypothetical protein